MSGFANLWSGSTLFPLSVTEGQPQLRAQAIDTLFYIYETGPRLQRAKQENIEGLEEGSVNMRTQVQSQTPMFQKARYGLISSYNTSPGNRREKAERQDCSGLLVVSIATGSVRQQLTEQDTQYLRPRASICVPTYTVHTGTFQG